MKKIVLVIMMLITLFTITACTYDESYKLIATYDLENRQCNISNISKDTDYQKLNVIVVLKGKNDFNKEITHEIGDLNSGETHKIDLSYISEDVEISSAYIKSFEYYQDDTFEVILLCVFVILLIFWAIMGIFNA